MSTSVHTPAFVTFTGVDRPDQIAALRALSMRYPVEWGVLIDPDRDGAPRFPARDERVAIQRAGLRLSAHVCGTAAQDIVEGRDPPIDLGGFSRVQVNHGRTGSSAAQIANSRRFGARRGVRVALQCQGEFPDEPGIDWLFDVSFGTGVQPGAWPRLSATQPFGGYSGGLGPANVADVVRALSVEAGVPFWIDMESAIRTDDRLDLAKCEAVCLAVF